MLPVNQMISKSTVSAGVEKNISYIKFYQTFKLIKNCIYKKWK